MIPTRFNPLGYQEPDYAGAIEILYRMRGSSSSLTLKEPLPTNWSNNPAPGGGPTVLTANIQKSTLANNIYVYILDMYDNKTFWTDIGGVVRFVPDILPGPITGPGTYYFLFQWMKKSIVLPYSLKVPYIKSTWGRD